MLHYAVVFLVIALVAALLGFGGLAAGAASVAKVLFVVFLIVAVVTFLLSILWDVPYQVGFAYLAIDAVFEAAIIIAMLTTLGAVFHPVVALLLALLFNEGTFYALRYGADLLTAQAEGGWLVRIGRPLVIAIHTLLPMVDPFSAQTAAIGRSMRVGGADWGYLLATAAYSLAVTAVCFLLADAALRRRSFATTT